MVIIHSEAKKQAACAAQTKERKEGGNKECRVPFDDIMLPYPDREVNRSCPQKPPFRNLSAFVPFRPLYVFANIK